MAVIQYDSPQDPYGIINAGNILAQTLMGTAQQRGQERRQETRNLREQQAFQRTGSLLEQELANLEETTPQSISQALSRVLSQGGRPELVQQFGTLYSTLNRPSQTGAFNLQNPEEIEDLFVQYGLDPQRAKLYSQLLPNLTVGGQTEFIKQIIEESQRAPKLGEKLPNVEPNTEKANVEAEEEGYLFPQMNLFEGLTPKERVSRQSELFKENTGQYNELSQNIRAQKAENLSINQLQKLNNSEKLPNNLGKIIQVDLKTGELRFPALANEETQLFVKTINEFVRKARDSFGARITNFELDKFLQGLPTLANTEEGRRLILSQMDAVNQLNQLYNDSLKEVYQRYGLRGIDRLNAEKIAEELRKPKEEELIEIFYEAPQAQKIYELKKNMKKNEVLVKFGEKYGYVTKNQLDEALSQGAKLR